MCVGLVAKTDVGAPRLTVLVGGVVLLIVAAYVVEWLEHRERKRPRIDIRYEWQEGSDKDTPVEVMNVGDEEARNIQFAPIRLRRRTFTLAPISRLLPGAPAVLRVPRDDSEHASLFFRTIIDALGIERDEHATGLKNRIALGVDGPDRLNEMVKAERQAHRDFENTEVTVTFEELNGTKIEQKYVLRLPAWSAIELVTLEFVSEREL